MMSKKFWFALKWVRQTTYPCTKLVVPSTGSMIHVGLSVRIHGSPLATDSSPIKLQHKEGKENWGISGSDGAIVHKNMATFIGVLVCMAHQCASSPNFCFRDPMMMFSTLSSVFVTRSTVELFVMILISLSLAFRISCLEIQYFNNWSPQ